MTLRCVPISIEMSKERIKTGFMYFKNFSFELNQSILEISNRCVPYIINHIYSRDFGRYSGCELRFGIYNSGSRCYNFLFFNYVILDFIQLGNEALTEIIQQLIAGALV